MIALLFSLFYEILHSHDKNGVFVQEVLFRHKFYDSNNFRIPAIAYLKDDSILTVCDIRYNHAGDLPAKIGVIARKRNNKGVWTDGYIISGPVRETGDGDPVLVVERKTGTVFCLWSGDKGFNGGSSPESPERVYFTRSYDNGVTWEEKHDITHFIYSNLCTKCPDDRRTKWTALFVSSGCGLQTRDGTLMFACLVRDPQMRNYILFTDDFGETWDMKPGWAVTNANEAKLVELENGTVLMSIRQGGHRKFAWTNDKGAFWYKAMPMPDVKDPGCNGEIRRLTCVVDGFDKNRIIHTLAYSGSRTNVSIMLSYDEGFTWPYKKVIEAKGSAYSAVDVTKEGEIFVYYEKDGISTYDMVVARVTLDWITDGADNYTKPKLLQWCLTDKKENDQCPEGSYLFNEKVFDQYVESYILYPEEIRYTFVDEFRDFTVNLSYEGLNTGFYDNLNSKKFNINFVGSRNVENDNRQFTFKNINPTFPYNQIYTSSFTLDNSELTITGASDCYIKIGNGQVTFRPYITAQGLRALERSISIPSNSKLRIQNTGRIYLENGNQQSVKLMEGSNIVITAGTEKSEIYVEGKWTQESAQLVTFENNGTSKNFVYINKENEDVFTGDSVIVLPDQTPTFAPTDWPKPTDWPQPSSWPNPTSWPQPSSWPNPTDQQQSNTPIPPTQDPSVPSQQPTNTPDVNPSNQPDDTKKEMTFSLVVFIGSVVGALVVGIIIGVVVVFCAVRKKNQKNIENSEVGVAFQSFA